MEQKILGFNLFNAPKKNCFIRSFSCLSSCVLLFVSVEVVAGAFLLLPSPAVAWQGDTATDSSWAGECRRQSSGMTNPSGARLWLNGAETQKILESLLPGLPA